MTRTLKSVKTNVKQQQGHWMWEARVPFLNGIEVDIEVTIFLFNSRSDFRVPPALLNAWFLCLKFSHQTAGTRNWNGSDGSKLVDWSPARSGFPSSVSFLTPAPSLKSSWLSRTQTRLGLAVFSKK